MTIKNLLSFPLLFLVLALNGCGGGGGGGSNTDTSTTANTYSISVNTTGLTGTGLTVGVSSDAGIETMSITSDGTRNFSINFPEGALYTVGIGSQPAGQSCSIGGNFWDTNMTSDAVVTVSCVSNFSVSGTISGLTAGDVTLKLNTTNETFASDGGFTFSNQISNGEYYAVSVSTQPPGQTCLVTNSSGLIAGANISGITVNCSDSVVGYKVGGVISGLYGAIKLNLNGIEEFSTIINGTFSFASSLAANTPYTVTVLNAPAGYTCFVNNGSGTIVSSDFPFVDINCESSSTGIKPSVDPDGAYLDSGETITLTLNGTTDLTLDSWDWGWVNPIPFSTALNIDDPYVVTIKTNPVGKSCLLYNSVGVIKAGSTPVIRISCVSDTSLSYTIGGSISNLSSAGLILGLDGRDTLVVDASSSSYIFPNPQLSYTSHKVSVVAHPTGQICHVTNSSVYVNISDVTNIDIICSAGPHSIGGSAIGITGTGLSLKLNGAEAVSVPSNGDFVFNTLLSDGMSYEVSIASQPTDQVCDIINATGWNISASINNTLVECKTRDYSVATNIKGYLSSTPLSLQLNSDEIIQASVNTISGVYPYPFNPVAFNTRLKTGDSYSVSIAAQPEGQLCSLTNYTGVIGTTDIRDIGAFCISETSSNGPYSISVTTSGLVSSGLVLQLNGTNDLVVSTNGYQSFSNLLGDTAAYTVSILSQPSSPIQNCKVVNGSGTVTAANVTEVSIQCDHGVQSRYPINGSRWLDYVKNDGVNSYSASDLACTPDPDPAIPAGGYNTCLNGGEFMVVSVPVLTSCTNVTAADALNAFNWICDDSDGVRILSNGLKTTSGLTELLDFNVAAFKSNFVTIYENSFSVNETSPGIWWSNTVKINNTESYVSASTIALVTESVPVNIEIAQSVAVVVQPGISLAGKVFSNKNYLWFEGEISSMVEWTSGLVFSPTAYSRVQNVQSSNNVYTGVVISGNDNFLRAISTNFNGWSGVDVTGQYNKLLDITADYNVKDGVKVTGNYNSLNNITANFNTQIGIDVSGDNLQINNLTTNNNIGVYGFRLYVGKSVVTNISASNNQNGGVLLWVKGDVNVDNVTSNLNDSGGGSSGIYISGYSSSYSSNVFSNLMAKSNGGHGITIEKFSDSSFSNITASNNAGRGVEFNESMTSPVNNVTAIGNVSDGIFMFYWDNTRIENLFAANNGAAGVMVDHSTHLLVNSVSVTNNDGIGYYMTSSKSNISSNILATNNGSSGIALLDTFTGSDTNILIGATSSNNLWHGFKLSMDGVNLSSILALNNGHDGINTEIFREYITISNVVTTNNDGYGFNIDSDNDYYTGLLEMGNNGLGDCYLNTSTKTFPGLAQDGPSQNNLNNDCLLSGSSDGILIPFVDASSSVVGKVVDDDTSTIDDDLTPGLALFENITSWDGLEHSLRTWGVDGAQPFADSSNQGACNTSGINCQIWDWSASISDTGNSGVAAVNNVVPLPLATDVLTMDWTVSSATSQTYCDTTYLGSVWDGMSTCTSTYLRHTQEIAGDSIGNDNTLCEKGETCLYMPNIGAYQGHGALIDAGTIGTGIDTITLKQYTTTSR